MLEDEVDAFLAQKYASVPDVTRIIKFEYFDWDKHPAETQIDARYFMENYNRAEVRGELGHVEVLSRCHNMNDVLES